MATNEKSVEDGKKTQTKADRPIIDQKSKPFTKDNNGNKDIMPKLRYPIPRNSGNKVKEAFQRILPGVIKKYSYFSNSDTTMTPGKGYVASVVESKIMKAVIAIKQVSKTSTSYEVLIEHKAQGDSSLSNPKILEKFQSSRIMERIINRWISDLRNLSNRGKKACQTCFKDRAEIIASFGRSITTRIDTYNYVLDEVMTKNNKVIAKTFMSYLKKIEETIYNRDVTACRRFGFESDLSNLYFDGIINNIAGLCETTAFIDALNYQFPIEGEKRKEENVIKRTLIIETYTKLYSIKTIEDNGRDIPDTFTAARIRGFFREDAIKLFESASEVCGRDPRQPTNSDDNSPDNLDEEATEPEVVDPEIIKEGDEIDDLTLKEKEDGKLL